MMLCAMYLITKSTNEHPRNEGWIWPQLMQKRGTRNKKNNEQQAINGFTMLIAGGERPKAIVYS